MMEKFDIPNGFKKFFLEELDGNLCSEEADNKELVLLSAPVAFDVKMLKGEQIIENGSKLLDADTSENGESVMKWELHSSSMSNDTHLNILLPSKLHDKHVLAENFSLALNIMPNMQIPTFKKSPTKEKVGTSLPRPCGLRTRWNPFGSGCPRRKRTLNGEVPSDIHINSVELLDKGVNIENSEYTNINTSCIDNADEYCITKKKKKKKKKKTTLSGNIPSDVDIKSEELLDEGGNMENREYTKSSNTNNINISYNDNLNEHCITKKKKKKTTLNGNVPTDVDIKSEELLNEGVNMENNECSKPSNTNNINTSYNVNSNEHCITKKKKKKKKTLNGNVPSYVDIKSEELLDEGVNMENIEYIKSSDINNINTNIDNVDGQCTIKKKRKKKRKIKTEENSSISQSSELNGNSGTKRKREDVLLETSLIKKKRRKVNKQAIPDVNPTQPTQVVQHNCVDQVGVKKKKKKKKKKQLVENTIYHSTNQELGDKKQKLKPELIPSTGMDLSGCNKKSKKKKKKEKQVNNGFAISVKKEPVDFDSDFDSDSEARILGVNPRKRPCSN